ncbi:MAG: hypothetical protein HQM05_17075 [Magnetococcales bacterium]|nr:hypothetical protein [Magnetococcales bacterium]
MSDSPQHGIQEPGSSVTSSMGNFACEGVHLLQRTLEADCVGSNTPSYSSLCGW